MAVRHRRLEQISFKKLCDMGSLDPGDLRSELNLKCLGEHRKWFEGSRSRSKRRVSILFVVVKRRKIMDEQKVLVRLDVVDGVVVIGQDAGDRPGSLIDLCREEVVDEERESDYIILLGELPEEPKPAITVGGDPNDQQLSS